MSSWFSTYGFAEVYPDLIVGAYPLDSRDVAVLFSDHVDRVLSLVEDEEYPPGAREEVVSGYALAKIHETRMNLVDFGHLPAERIEEGVNQLREWLAGEHRVYVHCRAGWQRSASLAAGVVACEEGLSIEQGLDWVSRHRPRADPLPHQRADLAAWWAERASRRI